MTDTNNIHLRGYAALTSTPYEVFDRAGSFMEVLLPGCFKRTLNSKPGPDVVLNVGHGEAGSGIPLARTTNNTLRLEEDSRGLKVDADLDPVRNDAVELASALRRGDVGQMSFAFRVTEADGQEWNDDYSYRRIRSLSINKGDESVVPFGMNSKT